MMSGYFDRNGVWQEVSSPQPIADGFRNRMLANLYPGERARADRLAQQNADLQAQLAALEPPRTDAGRARYERARGLGLSEQRALALGRLADTPRLPAPAAGEQRPSPHPRSLGGYRGR